MPKRRRLFTPVKSKLKAKVKEERTTLTEPNILDEKEVSVARGRLKGALMEVLEPAEDSDTSLEQTPVKKERHNNPDNDENSEDDNRHNTRKKSPPRQSYVLKLFDRSVDLSQFEENSPLYPICRAWMINQPKENYRDLSDPYERPEQETTEETVELPGPEGPVISRIPELLPEQKSRSKDNINLNYQEAPPPGREELLRPLVARWAAVRQAWLHRAQRVEERYEASQRLLNKINVSAL